MVNSTGRLIVTTWPASVAVAVAFPKNRCPLILIDFASLNKYLHLTNLMVLASKRLIEMPDVW